MPLVSVIITNYNGRKYLGHCLDSLEKGSWHDLEIILVDNGSGDASEEFVREKFPGVRVVQMGRNVGLAMASNEGALQAKGEFLFFLNNDTIADKSLVSELVAQMEADKDIGICGCRTLTYDGAKELNAGVACDIFGYPYGKGEPLYVDAGIFIRRSVFQDVGGFDPKLFLYGEDRDLCWRTRLYGYKLKVVRKAVFYHDSFCSINNFGKLVTNVRKRFMGEAFMIRTLLKNYSLPFLLMIMPIYLIINISEMFVFLLNGRCDVVFGAYLKAYAWNIVNLGDTLRLRRMIQAKRRVSDWAILNCMYKGSGKLQLFRHVGLPNIET